ncbi:MAG: hypothetical protein WA775_03015 [Psychroserpens sp.]|uniref:hypothetical protein n=1 Tax=Psychroserpens sp. TaxID=2020870 RepID=UPI003C9E386B
MGKLTQQERAQNYLGRNSEVSEIFGTSDGFLFEKRSDARTHSRTLKETTVNRYTDSTVEKSSDDDTNFVKSDFLKASVKTIKEELPDMTDVKELEGYVEEEKASTDPRSTAIEAIEKRIEELNEAA